MNSEFAIGLVNIKKMDFSYLNRYSHYVLRRFFDYALNDKEWVDDIIHNGTSHINKEHLLIILILSCVHKDNNCLLYTSPSPRDQRGSRMPSSA